MRTWPRIIQLTLAGWMAALLAGSSLPTSGHAAPADSSATTSPATASTATSPAALSVADFLPTDFVKDGSVNYQAQVQRAINAAAESGRTLAFVPMIYRLDESGLQLRSHLTLWMYGAVFQLDEKCRKDGQAFHGQAVSDLTLLGGEIAGHNDAWPEGVNLRGIYLTGPSQRVRIRDMRLHDLSSNGIGVFAKSEQPARDIWASDLTIDNCCNRYGDYTSDRIGPEPGSEREDQGLIAFYHVDDFVVSGCRLEKSRSDGTHFYYCRRGQFVSNKVYAAKMGGYFAETCSDLLAADNVIRDNGSRGATIERGSKHCTLRGNVIAASGREGLWAPDSTGLIVTGNIFDRNGRKPNTQSMRWNANVTIDEDKTEPTKSPTEDYVVVDNLFYTSDSQIAAIRVDAAKSTGIVLRNNMLRGENRRVLIEGTPTDPVTADHNE